MISSGWSGNPKLRVLRAICRDETIYSDPEVYQPERFLDADGRINTSILAPESRIFGSGRR